MLYSVDSFTQLARMLRESQSNSLKRYKTGVSNLTSSIYIFLILMIACAVKKTPGVFETPFLDDSAIF